MIATLAISESTRNLLRLTSPPPAKEHAEQAALIRWWNYQAPPDLQPLLFAIPNGGLRDVRVATKLKAEGVRPGVPDLFLAVASGKYHGLFIELKRRQGGKLADNQAAMIGLFRNNGYRCEVCYGWQEAKAAITAYLQHCATASGGSNP